MEVVDIAVVGPADPRGLLAHLDQTVKWVEFSGQESKDGTSVRQFVSWPTTSLYFDVTLVFLLNEWFLSPHLSLCWSVCPQVWRGSLCVGLFSFKTDKLKSSCPVALNCTSWMTRPVVKW